MGDTGPRSPCMGLKRFVSPSSTRRTGGKEENSAGSRWPSTFCRQRKLSRRSDSGSSSRSIRCLYARSTSRKKKKLPRESSFLPPYRCFVCMHLHSEASLLSPSDMRPYKYRHTYVRVYTQPDLCLRRVSDLQKNVYPQSFRLSISPVTPHKQKQRLYLQCRRGIRCGSRVVFFRP